MKLGVFVGSFNPVHKGHVKIVNYILDNKYVDKVLIIPTGNYWNKTDLINIKDRINMLKCYESEKIIIEQDINNLKYTYEIMNALKNRYKDDELYLVLGADNIIKFNSWKNYKNLIKYKFIIYNRDNICVKKYLNDIGKNDGFLILCDAPVLNISSTKIRNNINNKQFINKYLDKFVIDYINKNNLYR